MHIDEVLGLDIKPSVLRYQFSGRSECVYRPYSEIGASEIDKSKGGINLSFAMSDCSTLLYRASLLGSDGDGAVDL